MSQIYSTMAGDLPCQCYIKLYGLTRNQNRSVYIAKMTRLTSQIKSKLLESGQLGRTLVTEIKNLLTISRKTLLKRAKQKRIDLLQDGHQCKRTLELVEFIHSKLLHNRDLGKKITIKGRHGNVISSPQSEGTSSSDESDKDLNKENGGESLTQSSSSGREPCKEIRTNLDNQIEEMNNTAKTVDYHPVKSINDCRIVKSGQARRRAFSISWLDQEEETWEPEEHLDGCIELLRLFLDKNPQFGCQIYVRPREDATQL